MRISTINDDKGLEIKFIRFGIDFPKVFPYIMPRFYDKEAALLRPDKNFFFKTGMFKGWVALDGDKVVGRIAAMINPDIHFEKRAVGLIGLYEAESDYEITRQLIDAAVSFLKEKKCTYIWGPMSFSIWHGYRFKIDCFEDTPCIGEPQNPPYYPEYFKKYGFAPSHEWESHFIDCAGMQKIRDSNQEQYELFKRLGYQAEKAANKKLLHICWQLIMKIFKDFPGFSYIAEEDLLTLYEDIPYLMEKNASFFIKDPRGDYVGFVLVLKDLVAAITAMRGETDFLAKVRFKLNENKSETVNLYLAGFKYTAVREALRMARQKYNRPLSLGKVILYLTLREVLKSGRYKYAVLPLMRRDVPTRNWVRKLSVKITHHAMFELKIPQNAT